MKRILLSVMTVALVSAVAFGATRAFFTDEEKSVGNTLAAGVVDIVVNGQNPWQTREPFKLEDMKPSYTKYIAFTVRNLEESNEVNLWKHINITSQSDGTITEPECTEGGGQWTGGGTVCTNPADCCATDYTPRNNLAAYTLYDLYVCADPGQGNTGRCEVDEDSKPVILGDWIPIITENQYVRLDNISSAWIKLGQLVPAKELKVVQSYHLSSWPNAPEPEVTNWAQGDVMTFDIELMATQLNAPGPEGVQASVNLENKNPTTWVPIIDDIGGTLSYNTSGPTFNYSFTGKVPLASTAYCLIYYADPWPGDGKTHSAGTGMDIACGTSGSDRSLSLSGNPDLGDLPNLDDQNSPGGAKLQVVLDTDYDNGNHRMIGWNPSNYLFEMNLITYKKTP